MLFRLVRPVKRSASSISQFTQRIPADVRALAVGRTLVVPLGTDTVRVAIMPTMGSIRFSLRTQDPSEAKARQGQAAAALETFWTALRRSKPVTLDHRQATALAGALYRAWAGGPVGTTAVTLMPDGRWEPEREKPDEERAGLEAILVKLDAASEGAHEADQEAMIGPVVDRLLLRRGIASVDADTRRDAFANRDSEDQRGPAGGAAHPPHRAGLR